MPENNSATGQANDWLTTRRFALLLGLLVFASWPQVFLGLQTFVYRDFGYYSYPIAHFLRESFWRGEFPLWNPLSYCGIPFFAQWNTQALYPPALFYVVFPLTWSLAVFCLLHLYGAGLGMFLLARAWTGNSLAAAFAGVAYAFGGLMLNSLMWPGTIPGLCWMPWLVWLAPLAWREGGRWVVWAALAGAAQMLSGAVEPIMMTWLVLAGLGALDFFGGEFPRLKISGRAVLVGFLVAGISAAQLLPFLDLLQHSQRQGNYESAAMWPMPLTGWGNFLVPLLHEHSSFHGVFMQPNQYWTFSYYAGLTVVGLAAWAAWRVRERRVWCLWGLTLLCLVLALGNGTPIYVWCREHLPAIGTMRFPVKFVILPVFAFPLLAAVAVNRLRGSRWLAVGWATGVAVGVVLWCNYKMPLHDDEWGATWQNALVRLVFLAATLMGLWLAERTDELKLRRLWQLLVLVLVWLDGSHHAPQPQTVNPLVYADGLQRSLVKPRHGESRALIDRNAQLDMGHSFIPDVAQDYMSRRFALASNCNLMEAIPKINGFFPLQLREFDVFSAVMIYGNFAPYPHPSPLLDFLGVAEINSATNMFDWYPRTGQLPLLTAGQKAIFAEGKELTVALGSTNYNPRGEVFLRPADKDHVGERPAVAVKISEVNYAAESIRARLESPAPTLAVVAQAYYHPWHAYVDGQRVDMLRANHAFQAIPIPAGAHELRLTYEDAKFRLGVGISLGSLAVCVGLLVVARRESPMA